MRCALPGLLALLGCGSAPSGVAPGAEPSPVVHDLDGRPVRPLAFLRGDANAQVLVFLTVDCPIANSYAPEIAAICAEHAAEPLRFWLVHVDPDVTPERARAHAEEYSLPVDRIALDPEMELARRVGATVTPEVAIVRSDGELAYRGRIDDTWGDIGAKRPRTRRLDLRDALRAVSRGEPVDPPRTDAVGCPIPFELAGSEPRQSR